MLREHYRLVREELLAHRGFEVKVHGDGFMVAFRDAEAACRAAIELIPGDCRPSRFTRANHS